MACLVKLAESVRLKKISKKGQLREFSLIEIDEFIDSPEEVHGVFTSAEKQGLLRYALYNLRATPHERFLPGYPNIRLYHGQSIGNILQTISIYLILVDIQILISSNILIKLFPKYVI